MAGYKIRLEGVLKKGDKKRVEERKLFGVSQLYVTTYAEAMIMHPRWVRCSYTIEEIGDSSCEDKDDHSSKHD